MEVLEEKEVYEIKTLYPFQENTVSNILEELKSNGENFNLLYQLPTGGGKTVIFSEIAMTFLLKLSFFTVYLNTLKYLFWIIPSSIPLIFLEIGYLYMISQGLLKKVNIWFILVSLLYLGLALSASLISNNII